MPVGAREGRKGQLRVFEVDETHDIKSFSSWMEDDGWKFLMTISLFLILTIEFTEGHRLIYIPNGETWNKIALGILYGVFASYFFYWIMNDIPDKKKKYDRDIARLSCKEINAALFGRVNIYRKSGSFSLLDREEFI